MISSALQAVSEERQVRTSLRFMSGAHTIMAKDYAAQGNAILFKAHSLAADGCMHAAEKLKGKIKERVGFVIGVMA